MAPLSLPLTVHVAKSELGNLHYLLSNFDNWNKMQRLAKS